MCLLKNKKKLPYNSRKKIELQVTGIHNPNLFGRYSENKEIFFTQLKPMLTLQTEEI